MPAVTTKGFRTAQQKGPAGAFRTCSCREADWLSSPLNRWKAFSRLKSAEELLAFSGSLPPDQNSVLTVRDAAALITGGPGVSFERIKAARLFREAAAAMNERSASKREGSPELPRIRRLEEARFAALLSAVGTSSSGFDVYSIDRGMGPLDLEGPSIRTLWTIKLLSPEAVKALTAEKRLLIKQLRTIDPGALFDRPLLRLARGLSFGDGPSLSIFEDYVLENALFYERFRQLAEVTAQW